MNISGVERSKYEQVWAREQYSENSPGANFVDLFAKIVGSVQAQSVLDIGAGSGAASVKLKALGLKVTAFDLVDTAWRHGDIPLYTGSIWRDLPLWGFDYGYCCDVMEHIPPQFTALSIAEILRTCGKAFFSISFKQDVHGDAIRDRLHLTVQSFSWWRDMFRELGTVYEARDIIGDGIFYVGR